MRAVRRPSYAAGELKTAPQHTFVDPWRAVCERCPLFDCIRQEGEYGSITGRTWTPAAARRLAVCPVFVAQREGLTPGQVLAAGAVAGIALLEPVVWGAM